MIINFNQMPEIAGWLNLDDANYPSGVRSDALFTNLEAVDPANVLVVGDGQDRKLRIATV